MKFQNRKRKVTWCQRIESRIESLFRVTWFDYSKVLNYKAESTIRTNIHVSTTDVQLKTRIFLYFPCITQTNRKFYLKITYTVYDIQDESYDMSHLFKWMFICKRLEETLVPVCPCIRECSWMFMKVLTPVVYAVSSILQSAASLIESNLYFFSIFQNFINKKIEHRTWRCSIQIDVLFIRFRIGCWGLTLELV